MARPFQICRPGAREHLERMGENALLTELAAANALGMPLDAFNSVVANNENSREIWQDALSIEREVRGLKGGAYAPYKPCWQRGTI